MRGVLYIVWGDSQEVMLKRSMDSVRKWHPELPIHVHRINAPHSMDMFAHQANMYEYSPFDTTLHLDTDTIVMGRLDMGFEKAEQFSLAICINEAPYARRTQGLSDKGDMVEYNVGVTFFNRATKILFDLWKMNCDHIDASIRHGDDGEYLMDFNSQGPFALAVSESGLNPFILPVNWNLRPSWHRSYMGPVKIYHQVKEIEGVELRNIWYMKEDYRLSSLTVLQ